MSDSTPEGRAAGPHFNLPEKLCSTMSSSAFPKHPTESTPVHFVRPTSISLAPLLDQSAKNGPDHFGMLNHAQSRPGHFQQFKFAQSGQASDQATFGKVGPLLVSK